MLNYIDVCIIVVQIIYVYIYTCIYNILDYRKKSHFYYMADISDSLSKGLR